MKKAAFILLVIAYALSTLGFCLKEFYCCGTLKSVTLTLREYENQRCSGGENQSGCCKTKFQFYKVNDTHFGTHVLGSPAKLLTGFTTFNTYLQIIFPSVQQAEIANSNHAPPLYSGVATFISNCVFLV